ncbi:hypothetical protein [Halocatena halophila]
MVHNAIYASIVAATLLYVLVAGVFAIEVLYFERDLIEIGVTSTEETL